MKLTSTVVALLALVAGLVIAGCGDDDDETSATSTKAEFIAAADQICADADRELSREARAQYPEGPPIGEDAATFAEDVFIPNLQSQHDQIAALPPPEGEEEAVAELLDTLQAGIDELASNPEEFVESTALEDASAAAEELGLERCGQ